MTVVAIDRPVHGVRRRGMGRPFVAYAAAFRRCDPGAEVAPFAMGRRIRRVHQTTGIPPAGVASRGGLVVAPDAVIFFMTGCAPVPVRLGLKTVCSDPPGVRMVLRQLGIMAGDAIGLFMAQRTRLRRAPATRIEVNIRPVIPDPVRPMRLWPGAGYLFHPIPPVLPRCRSGKQNDKNECEPPGRNDRCAFGDRKIRNHTAAPV